MSYNDNVQKSRNHHTLEEINSASSCLLTLVERTRGKERRFHVASNATAIVEIDKEIGRAHV